MSESNMPSDQEAPPSPSGVEVITESDEGYLIRRRKYEMLAEKVDPHLERIDKYEKDRGHCGHDHHHHHHDDGDGSDMHPHEHYSSRSAGLRAAVLGANDGLVSVASLIFGVIGGELSYDALVVSAIAALIGGAISMGIGELISVYSSRDSEKADIAQEQRAHLMGEDAEAFELAELTKIYEKKGLSRNLAKQVAVELSAKDVLKAHLMDELRLDSDDLSNPWQAAIYSTISFVAGAILPVMVCIIVTDRTNLIISMCFVSSFVLLIMGLISGRLSGYKTFPAVLRIVSGGWAAMIITFAITLGVSIPFTR
eukprot:ANDGO_02654.mRNA.1 Fe(2+)/Mn(2+) transporter pcl1